VLLYVAGSFTHDVKPTVLSLPIILKLSLREMGRPFSEDGHRGLLRCQLLPGRKSPKGNLSGDAMLLASFFVIHEKRPWHTS
jgi:hypothetical protein